MIFYLTYGEYASGIFSSQVIDSCKEFSLVSQQPVKIISIIPLRHFFRERKKLKTSSSNILVLPAFPKMKFFKMNFFLLAFLCFFLKPSTIICRNAIPSKLGLMLRKYRLLSKVIFDGRAAEYEQFVEYKLTNDQVFIQQIYTIEKEAVNSSDFRIAVSEELVKYWRNKFGYSQTNHVVIPCTLNSKHLKQTNTSTPLNRQDAGYSLNDVILIYSGSISQWQSFDFLIQFFEEQLKKNTNIKIILLCKETLIIKNFVSKYSNKVKQLWCNEADVFNYLSLADYGILLREDTWTNRVASPVKFAEYLNAGLDVIISDNVGDFSKMVVDMNCGFIYNSKYIHLDSVDSLKREKNKKLVNTYFNKKSSIITEKYKTLFKLFKI